MMKKTKSYKDKLYRRAITGFLIAAMAFSPLSVASINTYAETPKIIKTFNDCFSDLYDDVVTNGIDNGFSAYQSVGGNFGIPYHSVETLYIDSSVDYGHLSLASDAAELVAVAALNDVLNKASANPSNDFEQAWKTLSVFNPSTQTGFSSNSNISVDYEDEWQQVEEYPKDSNSENTAINPLHNNFMNSYSANGSSLLQWLADTNDWYGFGGSTGGREDGKLTFINTFERGTGESVFDTVPHSAIEELKYGNARGVLGLFSTQGTIEKQWNYRSTGNAERMAVSAAAFAKAHGIENQSVIENAGQMADELRNLMYDKYYKQISETTSKNAPSVGYDASHYLFGTETRWGGALDGSWIAQTASSDIIAADQDPYTVLQLINGSTLAAQMKAPNAVDDYKTSLSRQLEFLLWLQANNGTIAPGATNSWNGRYESYPSGTSTFFGLAYTDSEQFIRDKDVYSINAQTDIMLSVAKAYYQLITNGDTSGVTLSDGTTVTKACKKLLDKWVGWILDNTVLNEDGTYSVPERIDFSGSPDTFTGQVENDNLTSTITDYSQTNFAAASDISSILLYYAKANGIDKAAAANPGTTNAQKALYYARELMARSWTLYRDSIGMSANEVVSGSYKNIFEKDIWIPTAYGSGNMPDGGTIANGSKFLDLHSSYKNDPYYAALEADYMDDGETNSTEISYHVFSEQCSALQSFGTAALLYDGLELNPSPAQIISVDIEWGELSFTYTDSSKGTWNPGKHQYENSTAGGWAVDNDGGDKITVTSSSNISLNVSFVYAQEAGSAVTGSFTDGTRPIAFPVLLAAGDISPQTISAYLTLDGKPEKTANKTKMGTITVTIGGSN